MNGYSRQGTLTKIFKFYIAEKTKMINVTMTKEKKVLIRTIILIPIFAIHYIHEWSFTPKHSYKNI